MTGLFEYDEYNGYTQPRYTQITKITRERLLETFSPLARAGSLVKLKKHPELKERLGDVQTGLAAAFLNVVSSNDIGDNPYNFLIQQFFSANGSFLYFRGLPVEENLPPTPQGIRSKSPPNIAEFISLATLSASGMKLSDLMIGNVVLRSNDPEIEPLSDSVSYEPYHTHASDADYGVLYCLRGAEEKVTSAMITTGLIKAKMPPELFELLLNKEYGPEGSRFSILEEDVNNCVFSKEVSRTNNFYLFLTELFEKNMHAKATPAILWLNENFKDISLCFSYEPGDMIIVNQRTTVRGILIDGLEQNPTHNRWLVSTTAKLTPDFKLTNSLYESQGLKIPEEYHRDIAKPVNLKTVSALLRQSNDACKVR